jgi:hypothetical protein
VIAAFILVAARRPSEPTFLFRLANPFAVPPLIALLCDIRSSTIFGNDGVAEG